VWVGRCGPATAFPMAAPEVLENLSRVARGLAAPPAYRELLLAFTTPVSCLFVCLFVCLLA